jgi:hypothetical protein
MAAPPAPSVPSLDERGWERTDQREEVRFELPTMRVRANTVVYEDRELRNEVRAATGVDTTWRFFFATRLGFEPPLPPLTGTASVYGSVKREARTAFVDDLRGRGIDDVERGRTERMRTETRDRVSLTRYRGTRRLDGDDGLDGDPVDVPVAGALGVWTHNGGFRLAGGGYPSQSLATRLSDAPATDPTAHRDELLELIRGTR